MFLDDEAVQMCEDAELVSAEDVQNLYGAICEKYEQYYKARIRPGMSKQEVKATLDRTFALWDSMVRQMKNKPEFKLALLAELLKKNSFKKTFMAHEEMADVYERLKQ